MEDLTKCTVSKCPFKDSPYKKYLEWYWQYDQVSDRPNITTCKSAIHVAGMSMNWKDMFHHCLDNVWYLFTDLGPEPSVEECKAVDYKRYQRIEENMWKS